MSTIKANTGIFSNIILPGGSAANTSLSNLTGFTDGSIPYVSGAGSALSQDATNFFWDPTNKGLKIGGGSTVAAQTQPNLYIASASTTTANAGFTHENASASAQGPIFAARKARGSLASPAAIASGDPLVTLAAFGYGTSYNALSDASMTVTSSETFTGSAHGTQFNFLVTPLGSTTKRNTVQFSPGGSIILFDNTGATQQMRINATSSQTMPSGTTAVTSLQALVATQNLGFWTANNGAGNSADLRLETGTATGTRGQVVLQSLRWPNTDGTSGQVLSTDGAGNLSFVTVSGGGSANTALSNLASVLINVSDFVFNAGADTTVHTRNVSGTSDNFVFSSGNSSTANSGSVDVHSGSVAAINQNTGQVSLRSFDTAGAAGTGVSGQVSVYTGSTTNGNSGNLSLLTGNSSGANSGLITIATGTAGGSRGQIRLQNGSEGTSGWVWTSIDGNGSGEWMAPSGGGASTDLSNLIATAINQDLIFDTGVDARLKTKDESATSSKNLYAITGDASGANDSGELLLQTGLGQSSGSLSILTGNTTAADFNSGTVMISTGAPTGIGVSGSVVTSTGNSVDGNSGLISLITGLTTGAGNSGALTIGSGTTSSSGVTGDVTVASGGSSTAVTGNVLIASGDIAFGSATSGTLTLTSGTANGSSGQVNLLSGLTGSGSSGPIQIATGTSSGAITGGVLITSGQSDIETGQVQMTSGGTLADDVNSGDAAIRTGSTSGTGFTGHIRLATGSGVPSTANSGSIILTTGDATTRGSINLNAPAIQAFDSHLRIIQSTPPVATVNANAGTGATSTVSNATDIAGIINLTTTAVTPAAGAQTSIAFDAAYATAPIVVITARNADTANFAVASGVYVTTTTTTMVINFATADAVGHAYSWFYHVIETS